MLASSNFSKRNVIKILTNISSFDSEYSCRLDGAEWTKIVALILIIKSFGSGINLNRTIIVGTIV